MKTKGSVVSVILSTIVVFVLASQQKCIPTPPTPPTSSNFTAIQVLDPNVALARALVMPNGLKLLVLGDKNTNGELVRVTGGGLVAPSGEFVLFWFGADGLPQYFEMNGWLFEMYDYDFQRGVFDLVVVEPDGSTSQYYDMESSGHLNGLLDLSANLALIQTQLSGGKMQGLETCPVLAGNGPKETSSQDALMYTMIGGFTASVVGCMTTPITTFFGAASCVSAGLTLGALLTSDSWDDDLASAVGVVSSLNNPLGLGVTLGSEVAARLETAGMLQPPPTLKFKVWTEPADPVPGLGVTVRIKMEPPDSWIEWDIGYTVVGTDGYQNSSSVSPGPSGECSFWIPGAEPGVTDHVRFEAENWVTDKIITGYAAYVF